MTEDRQHGPIDRVERAQAVDIRHSCIVQAPAGSGKTELLIQRILALLAAADSPEEILAITFTRKAAGEMKLRLLEALERAADDRPPAEPHARETWSRARAVLVRDRQQGWGLRENAARLQLLTIDSFCAYLTRRMPWLARFGAQPQVTDDPARSYREAAERLLSRIERGGAGQEAIDLLLRHLDNRMPLLRDLLIAMLGRRDQWWRHLAGQRAAEVRPVLEGALQRYIVAAIHRAAAALGAERCVLLTTLGKLAAENLSAVTADHPLQPLSQVSGSPGLAGDSLEEWLALAHLVLTGAGQARKSLDKRLGFPADKSPEAVALKQQMLDLLATLRDDDSAISALRALRDLPDLTYTDGQWAILEALIELLPLAVVELQEVFRLHGQVDFIAIAGAAHAALGQVDAPEELLLQLDSRFRHILVDEFQDTSYAQYELLRLLTAGWMRDDGRTLFVVGDPMQSIYRFREAEVGLFLRVCQRGLDDLPLRRLQLGANFRSQAALVAWTNRTFAGLFPAQEDEVRGAVRFSAASPVRPALPDRPVTMQCFAERQDEAEAEQVLRLVHEARAADPDGSIAVLVRSRTHLLQIVKQFRRAGLRFQAQDIDPLTERPVVQDLLALTRALLHPADRVAWLALLRAPWCGLGLDDLLTVCGQDPKATVWQLLTSPPEQVDMFEQVSSVGRRRLDRITAVLRHSLAQRGRLSLRRLVETAWLALGGPACVDEADLVDAVQVFALLDDLDAGGDIERLEELEERLGKLFAAPDPLAGPELQIMTIHKAKGLEFDTVIVPGLGRGVRARERALLRWLEHPDYELLLAPIPPQSADRQSATYDSIGQILQEKDDLETLRLFYVAVTRARSRLHLLGHVKVGADGLMTPAAGSLLAVVWPVLGEEFVAGVVAAAGSAAGPPEPSLLRRLPADWAQPAQQPSLASAATPARRASDAGHYLATGFSTRQTEEGRVIGTLVHAWLERIALDGLASWPPARLATLGQVIRMQLVTQGVPAARLDPCAETVEGCLDRTLRSERGSWLLHGHADASCELALSGMVDGELVHAVIDRTFIDEQGVRWIVDYKTSRPDPGEELAVFVSREASRYAPQMAVYRQLMVALDGAVPLRVALYFPLAEAWYEFDS